MYNIWKILFSAEKYHLNKHGRPIMGDGYIAMRYGTVPSRLYEETKNNNLRGVVKGGNTLYAERAPITNFFSVSDIEALEYGYNEYAGLSFREVEEKNHKEPAWIKNYELRGSGECAPIPFEDLIEEDWLKEELEQTSIFTVI
jgi:uncharacterized phage-associated protein